MIATWDADLSQAATGKRLPCAMALHGTRPLLQAWRSGFPLCPGPPAVGALFRWAFIQMVCRLEWHQYYTAQGFESCPLYPSHL